MILGAFHLAICTAFGLVLVIFSIIYCCKMYKHAYKEKWKKGDKYHSATFESDVYVLKIR